MKFARGLLTMYGVLLAQSYDYGKAKVKSMLIEIDGAARYRRR